MRTNKILVVDDDVDVVSVYTTILKGEGYEVISANNKTEGMKLAKEQNPDLVVLDVMMTTHHEGFDMRQEMKADSSLKDTPVIIQSSIDVLTTSDGQKESIQAMARDFRKDQKFKEMPVLLIKNLINDLKGVDYLSEDGKSVYFEVDGFLKKPVSADQLVPEVKKLLR